ncbi:MAG: LptF/LptG family permease [Planctomycetota bacterium]
MSLLDRYIVGRFLVNFAILLALLFLFASTIDVVLNLDEFVDVAKDRGDDATGILRLVISVVVLAMNFELPRLFQFYAYLHGLVAIGAMGFTLAQMHRNKELVAVMASGVSLHRVAMPFVVGVFALSLVQLLNQEWMLPRVAPLLLRGHGHIGEGGVEEFSIPFTPGRDGTLLQAAAFDPRTNTLTRPTILERDERGGTQRRITAAVAIWDDSLESWKLRNGQATRSEPAAGRAGSALVVREPLEVYATDLSPRLLMVRRYGQFAGMLSQQQINDMLRSGTVADVSALLRHRYARFGTVLVNVLVIVITLPFFLLREPSNLFRQSVICAGTALPVLMTALVLMTVNMPGLTPAVSVFLPAILLLPVAIARMTFIRT